MDIGISIVVATLLSYLTYVFKQPNLLAYILTGVLIGPMVLGLVNDQESIQVLGELGVAFLLYSAGMELDTRKLKNVGSSAVIGGVLQVVISFVLGYLVAGWFGLTGGSQVLSGLLLAFSSTMLITKILIDKNEINALHGKIIIGILIIQDVFALLFLLTTSRGTDIHSLTQFDLWRNIVIMLGSALLLNRIFFQKTLSYIAKDSQLLFMTSLSTLFLFLGMGYAFGFPMTAAALVAGLSLSGTPFSVNVLADIRPLREFFSALFFVALGMQITFNLPEHLILFSIILLILTVIIKPILLFLEYLMMGYGFSTSAFVGLYLGQASEFTFIILKEMSSNGLIGKDVSAAMTIVVILSMILTPYVLRLNRTIHRLNRRIKLPKRFTHRIKYMKYKKKPMKDHIVIIGCHRIGYNIAKYLKERGENVLVIDHDPETIYRLENEGGFEYLFGDAENEEILELAHIDKAKMVIITIIDLEASLFVIQWTRLRNKDALIIARAHRKSDALNLYEAGADWVVVPEMVGSNETVKQVDRFLALPEDRYEDEKIRHIEELRGYID